MTALWNVSILWSSIHIVVLFLLLFEPRYSWRTTMLASFAGCGAMIGVNLLAIPWAGQEFIASLTFFTCTVPSLVLFFVLSKYRDGRLLFLFCLTDTTSFWVLQVTNFAARLAGQSEMVLLAGRLLLFPLVDLLFWRYLRRPYLELQRGLNRGWWLFAAMGAVYYLLLMVTSVPVGTPVPDTASLLRIVLILVLMPLTYVTILRSLWQQMTENRTQAELEVLSTRQQLTLENLRAVQESSAALALARHDMLGNLGILQTLSQQGEYEKLDEYLAGITRQTRAIVPLKITDHPIVNAILTRGADRAKEGDVEFRTQVNLPDSLSIPDEDLAAFLINLVDNALEAAGEVPRKQVRWVEITMHIRGRYLFIEGRNTYSRPLEPGEEEGRFRSRKGTGHGYGLKIMAQVARRYESELQTEAREGVFLTRTALLMP